MATRGKGAQGAGSPEESDYKRSLGARLKRAAEAAGLKSEVLGERMEVGGATIRHWWAGRAEPSGTQLLRYAQTVNVPPEVLAYGVQGADSLITMLVSFGRRLSAGEDAAVVLVDMGAEADTVLNSQARSLAPDLIEVLDRRAPGGDWAALSLRQQRQVVLALVTELWLLPEDDAATAPPYR